MGIRSQWLDLQRNRLQYTVAHPLGSAKISHLVAPGLLHGYLKTVQTGRRSSALTYNTVGNSNPEVERRLTIQSEMHEPVDCPILSEKIISILTGRSTRGT